jgi:hypothetical protein
MAYMEDHDLCVCKIDRVEHQIRIANSGEYADVGFVGQVTCFGKFLEQTDDSFDAIDGGSCGCAVVFVNIGKDVVDVRQLSDQRTLMRCSD